VRDLRIKKRPTHDLKKIQETFDTTDNLVITGTARRSAFKMGYALEDVVEAVQDLMPEDFVHSKPAHSPAQQGVWHDSYIMPWDKRNIFIKFAGATIVDIALTSFKERDR
jgi:motility quorum-sensing regulator/GCU-specific mRNA interferase toxin